MMGEWGGELAHNSRVANGADLPRSILDSGRPTMRIVAGVLSLLGVATVLACAHSTSSRWPPEGAGRIAVIDMKPAHGSAVDADTVLEVTLEYSLPAGYPGVYIVAPQFATEPGGPTVSGTMPGGRPPALDPSTSTVRLSHPLRSLIEDPKVAKPLVFWFYLNFETGGNKSSIVARTGPYRLGVR